MFQMEDLELLPSVKRGRGGFAVGTGSFEIAFLRLCSWQYFVLTAAD